MVSTIFRNMAGKSISTGMSSCGTSAGWTDDLDTAASQRQRQIGQMARAQKKTDASGWKYPLEQQRVRESENAATQTDDQNDPNQVVESQSQQAVMIASRDANSRLGSMACPVCV